MKTYAFAMIMALVATGFAGHDAKAADLSYRDNTSDYESSGSPYDDPRYASIYGRTETYSRTETSSLPRRRSIYRSFSSTYIPADHYGHDHDANARCDRSYRSDYSSRERRDYSRLCLTKHEIRRRLRRQGWRDFELVRTRADYAVIKARQIGGDLYRIRVDRCNGDVLRARVIDSSYYGDSYAYRYKHRAGRYRTY